MDDLRTDYLIVGAGAVGLAFADVLLTETDADIVIVDRRHKPGGHWNDAYPFVTLHQPSAFYGVSSIELSSGAIDAVGLNAGLHELASGARVLSYFDEVMHRRFLPSGRVRYLPSTDWLGEGRCRRLADGAEFRVETRRTVDATYYGTTIPATHTPAFTIDPGARVHPPNDLPGLLEPDIDYVLLGGGKTAIDAARGLDAEPAQYATGNSVLRPELRRAGSPDGGVRGGDQLRGPVRPAGGGRLHGADRSGSAAGNVPRRDHLHPRA